MEQGEVGEIEEEEEEEGEEGAYYRDILKSGVVVE